ncbi:translocation/assembly module TamB domain-containing protein [Utexia brackfieldae]|uniref:autotransporter assembly complex protein TamB n=1 Tax=Utexia brackfieldae TaxID=3074108 RepID=UPI00370D6DBD
MIKLRKRSIIPLSVLLFLLVFFAVFIYTSLGLRMVSYVLNKYVPEVQIEQVDGALYDFEVKGFALKLAGIDVKVDHAALAISGLCLLEGKICIKDLEAKNVLVDIDTSKFTASPTETEETDTVSVIKTPIAIELRKSNLDTVKVNVDDMHFGLDLFQGQASWVKNQIVVFSANIDGVKAIFPDTAPILPKPAPKSTVSLQTELQNLFAQPLLSSLPNVNIPVNVIISELKGDNWLLHMGNDYRFNQIALQGNVIDSKVSLSTLSLDSINPYQNARVQIQGNILLAKKWPLSAKIALSTLSDDKLATTIKSQIDGELLGVISSKTDVSGKNNLKLDANINFIKAYLPVKIKLTGQSVQWPLTGDVPLYQLNDFNLDLAGRTRQLSLSSQGAFKGIDLPDVAFELDAQGNQNGMVLNHIRLQLPQGKIETTGNVDWQDKLIWHLNTDLAEINLPSEIPNFPLNLNGQLKLQGWLDKQQRWQIDAPLLSLNGSMRRAPFSLSGGISANSDLQISAQQFKLMWGSNTLALNGDMQDAHQLQLDINMPTLAVITDGLTGKIKGHFDLSGSLLQPNLQTNVAVDNFTFNGVSIGQILLEGRSHYNKQVSGELSLQVNNLIYGDGVHINNMETRLSGSEQDHQLTVNVQGEPVEGALKLTGHINSARTAWSGLLVSASLDTPAKEWTLNKSVPLSYDFKQPKITVGANCWLNGDSSICLTKDMIITNQGHADLELKDLDLKIFDLILGGDTQIMGKLSAKASIDWNQTDSFPVVKANVHSSEVYIKQALGTQTLTIPFDIFDINLNMNSRLAKLDWRISLKEYGDISGQVEVIEPATQKKLAGQLNIDKLSLSIFTPALQGDDYAEGLINARLKFGGTLTSPEITGKLALNQSDIKASQLPADIKSIALTINFLGHSSSLDGVLKTAQGNINLNGQASWKNIDTWQAKLAVKGEGILITMPPMLSMTVVPDINITANQDEINLNGRVRVPTARITVDSLPDSIVDVSPDEVLVNENMEEIQKKTLPFRINSNLMVIIGDDVKVNAFGLNADLKGQLFVRQNKQGLGLHGQIIIPNGRFHAYGQDLVIRKGELIFSGPVDLPQLNIEAIRNPDSIANNVIAGIRVTGLADNPKIELFSDPAMSDQEILSYILRGQGLEGSDQSENDMMTAILIGLGTAQGGKYVGNIGEAFGIKDLSLDTQGVGNNSQVVVSGYILPNLQVKYGVGIFDSFVTLTLRYRLLPKLYLEVVSGLAQSVDLLYQFEF